MKKVIFLLLCAVGVTFSCSKQHTDDLFAVQDETPFITYLQENSDHFSLWLDLLDRADLRYTMNSYGSFTFFVPDNDAISAYLTKNGYGSVSAISAGDAEDIIKYHTISTINGSSTTYDSSLFTGGAIPDTTASGDLLSIEFKNGGKVYLNGVAELTTMDIELTNGVMHVIDAVLDPITQMVGDVLQNSSRYGIFYEAIQATGYDTELVKYREYTLNSSSVWVEKKYYFTVFPVADSTYNAAGIGSLNALASHLGASSDYTNPENELNRYISYHLLEGVQSLSDLADYGTDTTRSKNVQTMAAGELINFRDVIGVLYLNYNEEDETGARLINYNISAKNGVLHEVNDVLEIQNPPAVNVLWEFTDYAIIRSLAGSSRYRVTTLSNEYTLTLTEDQIPETSFKWEAQPFTNQNSSVVYHLYKSSTSPQNQGLFQDYLDLSLGQFGWIEFTTPFIVAGNYKLTLYLYSPAGTSGEIRFVVDGQSFGSAIRTQGLGGTNNVYTSAEIGEITFTENTTHTFRINCQSSARLYLDYIYFEAL